VCVAAARDKGTLSRITIAVSHAAPSGARGKTSKTFPQIFINGKGIGGFDDLYRLDREGALDRLLVVDASGR
jgi:glutaredoxin